VSLKEGPLISAVRKYGQDQPRAMSSPSLKMPSLSPTAPTQVSAAGPKRLDESLQTSDLALQKLHPGLQLQQFLACQTIDARKRLGIETHPF
jgi:hypothetical protein